VKPSFKRRKPTRTYQHRKSQARINRQVASWSKPRLCLRVDQPGCSPLGSPAASHELCPQVIPADTSQYRIGQSVLAWRTIRWVGASSGWGGNGRQSPELARSVQRARVSSLKSLSKRQVRVMTRTSTSWRISRGSGAKGAARSTMWRAALSSTACPEDCSTCTE